ncbi:ribosomal RNA small subunit methyltransferase A [Candidatus Sumerlaeota bacterium]|nr:ribosomal RNA small subunit methyltransferase A [Candidatus Sumerlaeota bacterium]
MSRKTTNKNKPHYSTRALLREYRRIYTNKPGRLKKSLGQHLLANEGMLKEIARVCNITPESLVIEIGAGVGNLTQALLHYNPRRYVGIELDERFRSLHTRFFLNLPGVEFIYADVLKVDFAKLCDNFKDVVIVGNIPYQITSPLIMKLITGNARWSRIVLTTQKEVAERLVAEPGSKKISGFSIKVQLFARPSIVFFISASNFIPQPKVDSAVILLTPHPSPLLPEEEVDEFLRLIGDAFSQRRKTILNALTYSVRGKRNKNEVRELLKGALINPEHRAEQLNLEDFLRLYHLIKKSKTS